MNGAVGTALGGGRLGGGAVSSVAARLGVTTNCEGDIMGRGEGGDSWGERSHNL